MAGIRLKLAGAVATLAALYGCWLWVRDSPVFQVQQVRVSGLSGANASLLQDRLVQAAQSMTTTHVDAERLRSVLAPYTPLAALKVSTQFPHGMRIEVREQLPAMALVVGGRRVAVAPDGRLLRGPLTDRTGVPDLPASALPVGATLRDRSQLRALALLDAAPAELRRRAQRVSVQGAQGIVVFMRRGPQLLFGDSSMPHAKWLAAAAVLADPTSRGARYIDVRVPDRPAAQVGDPATMAPAQLLGSLSSSGGSAAAGAGAGGPAAGAGSTAAGAGSTAALVGAAP